MFIRLKQECFNLVELPIIWILLQQPPQPFSSSLTDRYSGFSGTEKSMVTLLFPDLLLSTALGYCTGTNQIMSEDVSIVVGT